MLKVRGKSTVDESEVEGTYKTVFLAVGREPCTKNIGLEELNIEFQGNR